MRTSANEIALSDFLLMTPCFPSCLGPLNSRLHWTKNRQKIYRITVQLTKALVLKLDLPPEIVALMVWLMLASIFLRTRSSLCLLSLLSILTPILFYVHRTLEMRLLLAVPLPRQEMLRFSPPRSLQLSLSLPQPPIILHWALQVLLSLPMLSQPGKLVAPCLALPVLLLPGLCLLGKLGADVFVSRDVLLKTTLVVTVTGPLPHLASLWPLEGVLTLKLIIGIRNYPPHGWSRSTCRASQLATLLRPGAS